MSRPGRDARGAVGVVGSHGQVLGASIERSARPPARVPQAYFFCAGAFAAGFGAGSTLSASASV